MTTLLQKFITEIALLAEGVTAHVRVCGDEPKRSKTYVLELCSDRMEGASGFNCPEFYLMFNPDSNYIEKYLQILEKAEERGVLTLKGNLLPTNTELEIDFAPTEKH